MPITSRLQKLRPRSKKVPAVESVTNQIPWLFRSGHLSVSHPDVHNFDPDAFGQDVSAKVRKLAGLPHTASVEIGVILGSGLGDAVERLPLEESRSIEFHQLPNMVVPGVKGHKGRLIIGRLGKTRVAFLLGRLHAYEGHSTPRLLSGVAILAGLGTERLIVTNAAGGISAKFAVGDLMLISDHVRYPGSRFVDWHHSLSRAQAPVAMRSSGEQSIAGRSVERGAQGHLSLSGREAVSGNSVWCPDLLNRAGSVYSSLAIHRGVYAMMPGPMYETPAEIRMMRHLGVDAVGMSTVPESVYAASRGIRVLGVSCITNVAAGLSEQPLCHSEVTANAASVEHRFADWLRTLIPALCE